MNEQPIIAILEDSPWEVALKKSQDEGKIIEASAQVSIAIFEAEKALVEAVRAWNKVLKAEEAFSLQNGILPVEKAIADRGIGSAKITIHILQSLL